MESTDKLKLKPNSTISTFNCSNCGFIDDCNAERIKFENSGVTLANYWCWGHSSIIEPIKDTV